MYRTDILTKCNEMHINNSIDYRDEQFLVGMLHSLEKN